MADNIVLIITVSIIVLLILPRFFKYYWIRFLLKKGGDTKGRMQNISGSDAKELIKNSSAVIIDVRTAGEFSAGHIPNAIHIPVSLLSSKAEDSLPDKSQKIILYCQTGMRSMQALYTLHSKGYTDLYNLGSIHSWAGDFEK
ncbi:rhodanese-like domain-containing protein [Treponema phagedenis]|uniref:Rhodanese-like domain-containing protein n=1 Tax=Treponema phagedenis TaxID=162 RepID=A0A0B7GZW1_TREPH|nr:rhodanese-like domain-containing protein [Treponema phagedenis]EFW38266.1 rhodanese-like protein [Treponema phagedenis F0421]QEJ94488.1 rhodanese-like domain-containing protein [Treponema phagedenis]QEJ97554.1 rhodanese-like domain-containing protein [Treponema phagedenis]QEK01631.1 rhodanese-like domain-containing protein [Treponema phagedenis]QEK03121.1 rhodanese-like domain-containing protein [Treponema phagedenis]